MAAAVSSARSALSVCGVTFRMSRYRMKAGAMVENPALGRPIHVAAPGRG